MEEFEINNSIYDNLEKTENKNDILRQLFDYKSVIFEDNNKIIDYGEISINGLNDEILILQKEKEYIELGFVKKSFIYFKTLLIGKTI
ncbi:hypothetical protein GWK89_14030 [Gluconobacter kondonii]|nr:hypothetical protein [Gluconobacter kondonii]